MKLLAALPRDGQGFSYGAPQSPHAGGPRVIRIKPRSAWYALELGELWHYRELLWILALRDIRVRYKQTALGAAWAIIQPVFTMIVFSVFFGTLGGMSQKVQGQVPYPIYTFCALLPWQLFANALNNAGNSLVLNQNLITKVYFPRLLLPLSSIVSALLDFGIAFGILLLLMAFYGIAPTLAILTVPFFVILAFATAAAVGLWLAALNVEYRDIRYVIPFLTQFWMFLSPVAYPSSIVPANWQWLYGINPLAGIIEGFRWAILGKAAPPSAMLLVSFAMVFILLIGGLLYFRRMEDSFADVI
jgi:lipopolysaccharide transport system permease protein